jgi:hypothetical protein
MASLEGPPFRRSVSTPVIFLAKVQSPSSKPENSLSLMVALHPSPGLPENTGADKSEDSADVTSGKKENSQRCPGAMGAASMPP